MILQVTGLLKSKTQDYVLTGRQIALDLAGEEAPDSLFNERSASNLAASAAGCSNGPLSTIDILTTASLVVTGVFDGHGWAGWQGHERRLRCCRVWAEGCQEEAVLGC